MRELTAYLPMDRCVALAQGQELPDRASGVALFADISGFTPLTAVLAQELGPQRGVEELARQLNRVYSALIAEVHRFGGSVINFSGDAITCWFESHRLRQAVASALAMQRVMAQFKAVPALGGKTIQFGVKIALAAGPARRFLVGNPAHGVVEVLAGATLDRMAAAERYARQDEVVIGAELIDELKGQVIIQEWREGATGERYAVVTRLTHMVDPDPWATPGDLDREITRAWLIRPVYERLQRGEGEFLTELRSAAVLFLKFSGIEYDQDAEAGVKLDVFVRRVQAIIDRYEGYLIQLTVGDKGCYLYSAFGAPIAHEDDLQRAILVALELRSLPAELDFIDDVQLGISQGRMRVGAYGAPSRRTYGVLGHETNIAARLMSLAKPGQILIPKYIAESVGQAYRFEDLGPISVKGRDQPLAVFAVIGRHQARPAGTLKGHVLAQMVGREAERQRVAAKLQALLEGNSSCLIIEGEAGIGKSRLVAEIREQTQTVSCTYLASEASAIEQSTPYYAWRFIFSQLLGIETFTENIGPETRQAWRDLVLAHVEQHAPERAQLAPLLNVVLPLDLPDNELTSQMTGKVRADNTNELLITILQKAAAKSPLLLVLDDAHWLDSASWTLARLAKGDVDPLLLVIVTRPLSQPQPAGYIQLAQAPGTGSLHLHSLRSEEITTLICQRLGVSSLPQPLADLILAKAEGHPFFSEELAFALRDAGLITIADGRCEVTPGMGDLNSLNFPDTIEGVIISRIDHLPPQHQLTLKVASVIGRIFAFRILRDLHPIEDDKLRLYDHLNTLEALGITLLETPEPDLAYFFKHIITQEVTYNLITFDQRRQLHHVVAEWYERAYADDLSPFYTLLAYHWGRAENTSKAIDYLEQAGEQALHNNANQEAARFFREALDLDKETRRQGDKETRDTRQDLDLRSAGLPVSVSRLRRARWLRQLGTAYFRLGRMPDSKTCFRQALELLGAPLPATPRKLAMGLLGHVAVQLGHRLMSGRFIKQAQGTETARLAEAAEVYRSLIPIYFITHETTDFIHATLASLNLAEKTGAAVTISEGYVTVGLIVGLLRSRWAEAYFDRAIAVAYGLNSPSALGMAYGRRGVYRVTSASWREGLEDYTQALAWYRQINDQRNSGDCLNFFMRAYHGIGKFHIGIKYAVVLYTAARKSGNAQHEGWGLTTEAMCLLGLGQIDAAAASAELAQQVLGKNISDTDTINVKGVLAVVHAHRGDMRRALELAKTVSDILLQSPPILAGIRTGFGLALDVYLAAWEAGLLANSPAAETQQLAQTAKKLCRALRRFAGFFRNTQPEAWYWQGRYDWLANKPDRAFKLWRKSLALAQELELPYYEGQARYELGIHLPVSDPERQAHLQRAYECFVALGATADIERTRAILATAYSGLRND